MGNDVGADTTQNDDVIDVFISSSCNLSMTSPEEFNVQSHWPPTSRSIFTQFAQTYPLAKE
jgi:hypothetical protein